MEQISIIIAVYFTSKKPRSIERLDKCLHSLRNQTVDENLVEIIVSDYESEENYQKTIKEYCQEHQAKYVLLRRGTMWNKARTLNVGIGNSNPESKYILIADVDMIFSPLYLETVLAHCRPNHFIICKTKDLPQGTEIPSELDKTIFEELAETAIPHKPGSGISAMPRQWIFKIRGFDEEYQGWGCEDDDLVKRAKLAKLKIIYLSKPPLVLHQYHTRFKYWGIWQKNRKRFHSLKTVVRNEKKPWGMSQV